jgi:hypothetical protein
MVQSRIGRDVNDVLKPLKDITEEVIKRDIGGDPPASAFRESADSLLLAFEEDMKTKNVSEELAKNKESIETVLIVMLKVEPETFEYFEAKLQKKLGEDSSWKPLKDLAEEVKDLAEKVELEADSASDESRPTTPRRLEDLPSAPTEDPGRGERQGTDRVNAMLESMHRVMRDPIHSEDDRVNIISDIETARDHHRDAFKYLYDTVRERARTDESWITLKDLVEAHSLSPERFEQLNRYMNNRHEQIIDQPINSTRTKIQIENDLINSPDTEIHYLERKVRDKLSLYQDLGWSTIEKAINSAKSRRKSQTL